MTNIDRFYFLSIQPKLLELHVRGEYLDTQGLLLIPPPDDEEDRSQNNRCLKGPETEEVIDGLLRMVWRGASSSEAPPTLSSSSDEPPSMFASAQ